MAISLLIIGQAGRLRDGLSTILRSFSGIEKILTADDFKSGSKLMEMHQPSVVIIDADESLLGDCIFLKKLLSQYRADPLPGNCQHLRPGSPS